MILEERLIRKGKIEGKTEGKKLAKTEIASKMMKDGIRLEVISKLTGLPETDVKKLMQEKN